MIYLTGAHPDRQTSRDRDRDGYDFGKTSGTYLISYASEVEFAQPIRWIRDQPVFPDCVGESIAECIDATLPSPPWASGVSIWRDARRRQGLIETIDVGTRIEYAVDALLSRGWDPYRQGEERDEVEAGKGAPPAGDDLADEMFAADKVLSDEFLRYRIFGLGASLLDAVDEALRRDFGIIIGTGLREPFMNFSKTPDDPEQVLGTDFIGGSENNHAQRVAGRGVYGGRRRYLVQNHWSKAWGGCRLPSGIWQPGCSWVDEEVVAASFDIHVVQLAQQKGVLAA